MRRFYYLKRRVRLAQRFCRDLLSGQRLRFSTGKKYYGEKNNYCEWSHVEQHILPTSSVAQKMHNLRTAMEQIEYKIVCPGEIFSYWHWVGNPSERKGYRAGRTIVKNELSAVIGGGLCQLSGIMYHAALMAGLKIIERHPHSLDIYQEAERYAPLGTDATVVYGYKDFRFLNNTASPLFFKFFLDDQRFECSIMGLGPRPKCQLIFERSELSGYRVAEVRRVFPDGTIETIRSVYILLNPNK